MFSIWQDGRLLVSINTERLQTVCAYLFLQAQTPTRRDYVSFQLWPDLPEAQARQRLRKAIHDLCNTPEQLEELFLIDRNMIGLQASVTASIDAIGFRKQLEDIKNLPTDEAIAALETALSLYQGDFLPGCDGAWVISERAALQQLYCDKLQHLIDLLRRRRQYGHAIKYGLELIKQNNLSESNYQQLMMLYSDNGDCNGVKRVYRLCVETLITELAAQPSDETQSVYEQAIKAASIATPPLRALPPHKTPFIGRTNELTQLHRLLTLPTCRLITITGPGGVGKTRLALHLAEQVGDQMHGVAYVALNTVSSTETLASVIANVLGLPIADPTVAEAHVFDTLRSQTLLLVLDNFEHLQKESGFLGRLLGGAPTLKLLVTSRHRLNLSEEWVFVLNGLQFPSLTGPLDGLAGTFDNAATTVEERTEKHDAVQLFILQAKRVYPSFDATTNFPAIAQICQLLEGMPLAIELAASWTRMLPCTQIINELGSGLHLLTKNDPSLPIRQQSMQATFDHSWQLLAVEEQLRLAQLTVFRGSFSSEAASYVTDSTLQQLTSLLDKSLIRRVADNHYALHELMRQYGSKKLAAQPEAYLLAHKRHCAYYVQRIEQNEEEIAKGVAEPFDLLKPDWHNVVAAWEWASQHLQGDFLQRMLIGFLFFYEGLGWFNEGLSHLERALNCWEGATVDSVEKQLTVAKLKIGCASYSVLQGKFIEANTYITAALATLHNAHADKELGLAYLLIGIAETRQGNFPTAEAALKQSIHYSLMGQFVLGEGASHVYLGDIARLQQDFALAETCYQHSLDLARRTNSYRGLSENLTRIGHLALSLQEGTVAQKFYQESLTLAQRHGDLWMLTETHYRLGLVAVAEQEHETAKEHFQAAMRAAIGRQENPLAMLNVIYGVAQLWRLQGDVEHAIEYLTMVLNHPAVLQETRIAAEREMAYLCTQLQPPQRKFAQTKGHALRLAVAVEAVLAW